MFHYGKLPPGKMGSLIRNCNKLYEIGWSSYDRSYRSKKKRIQKKGQTVYQRYNEATRRALWFAHNPEGSK